MRPGAASRLPAFALPPCSPARRVTAPPGTCVAWASTHTRPRGLPQKGRPRCDNAPDVESCEDESCTVEHQQALDDAQLRQYAGQIGLDLQRFNDDLAQHTYLERVRQDLEGAAHSDVHGTPTFFIDGERFEGGARASERFEGGA